MSHSDFLANRLAQPLEMMLENVCIGRVTATTIARQQDGCCIAITLPADPIPIPAKAVAGEFTRVMRQADVDMAAVHLWVEDTVRNDDAIRPGRKVMVERLEGLVAANSPLAVQLSEMLFRLGVHRKPRISSRFILVDQLCNSEELGISVRMLATSKVLADLAAANARVVKPGGNGVSANGRAEVGESLGQHARGEICKDNIFLIGIPGGSYFQA